MGVLSEMDSTVSSFGFCFNVVLPREVQSMSDEDWHCLGLTFCLNTNRHGVVVDINHSNEHGRVGGYRMFVRFHRQSVELHVFVIQMLAQLNLSRVPIDHERRLREQFVEDVLLVVIGRFDFEKMRADRGIFAHVNAVDGLEEDGNGLVGRENTNVESDRARKRCRLLATIRCREDQRVRREPLTIEG